MESIALAKKSFDLAGVPVPTIYQLKNMLDDKVWDIYSNGLTCTINQYDSDSATGMSKKYKPKSVKEVSMFNGAIRPNFNDYRDSFMSRSEFSNGNKFLDDLFQSTDKYIIYQENLMQFFEALGIRPCESIGLIKKISKKKIKPEMFEALVDRLKNGWLQVVGDLDEFDETWEKIQTFMSYGFNSPHSLAMAYDSLYEAYPKAHYPLAYYTVALEMYSDDERRTRILTEELSYFGIKLKRPKFRYSKSEYLMDKESNSIYKGIKSYKYLNEQVSNELYNLRDKVYNNFIELLEDLLNTSINSRQLDILIRLGFFEEFGKGQYLLDIVDIFNALYGKKILNLTKLPLGLTIEEIKPYANKLTEKQAREIDMKGLINHCISKLENKELSMKDTFEAMMEYQGYIDYKDEAWNKDVYVATNIKVTKWSTFIGLYNLHDGTQKELKVDKRTFNRNPLQQYDTIYAIIEERDKKKKVDGQWVSTGEKQSVLANYRIVV